MNVIWLPGGTVKVFGLAPVAVMVIVVPPDGCSEGDDVDSFEHPPTATTATVQAQRVACRHVNGFIPLIRPAERLKVKRTFA